MQKTIELEYDGTMDMLNTLEVLAKALPEFGVKLEILEGGDGYEKISLTKLEEF